MPFSESNDGSSSGQYAAGVAHVETGLGVTLSIVSNNTDGSINEADAEKILADIASILAVDSRFIATWVTRTRTATDAWIPPSA